MNSRFDVLLNDVSLRSVHDGICITDISYPSVPPEVSVAQFAGRDGGYVVGKRKSQSTVTVSFEIHLYDTKERQSVCQQIISWAKGGGKLQTSDRVDQYLQCVCTRFPSVESALKWTDAMTIEFTAYAVPYWQDLYATETTLTGAEATGAVFVPGNAETVSNVEITASNAITALTVGFGSTSITLSGLTVAQGDVITFSHDENGILSIKQGATSLLNKRTASSSDDLKADCGNIPVSVTASASVTAKFSAKGVWN